MAKVQRPRGTRYEGGFGDFKKVKIRYSYCRNKVTLLECERLVDSTSLIGSNGRSASVGGLMPGRSFESRGFCSQYASPSNGAMSCTLIFVAVFLAAVKDDAALCSMCVAQESGSTGS